MSKIITENKPGKIVDIRGTAVEKELVDTTTKDNMIAALEKLVEGLKSGEMRTPESITILPRFENEMQLIYLGSPIPTDMVYAQLSKFVLRMGMQ